MLKDESRERKAESRRGRCTRRQGTAGQGEKGLLRRFVLNEWLYERVQGRTGQRLKVVRRRPRFSARSFLENY